MVLCIRYSTPRADRVDGPAMTNRSQAAGSARLRVSSVVDQRGGKYPLQSAHLHYPNPRVLDVSLIHTSRNASHGACKGDDERHKGRNVKILPLAR